ncbi:DNA repair protein RadC [Stenotrophomonas maltophilia]|nr:DNA repair protein RadC [Stenotrophomonas maltophilia]
MENLTLWNDSTAAENEVLAQAEAILRRRINDGQLLSDPAAAGRMLRYRLAGRDREFFTVILLDTRHRVLAVEELFAGTIDGAEVHPREVVKYALVHNAAACILGHNHPSGNPEPSAADRAVTAQLKQALSLIDVRLLDHFVVGSEGATSMAARGWV